MNNIYINFYELLDEFLNQPLSELAIHTHLTSHDKYKVCYEDEYYSTYDEMNEWKDAINSTEKYKPAFNFDSTYIVCIMDDKLKVAQYSNKYLMDDLMYIKDFLINHRNTFIKKLKKTYFLSIKYKYKYLNKAKKKNLNCLYYNDNVGVDIFSYILGKEKKYYGDKHGIQNCILDNIDRSDNLEKKFIIILNFDNDLFELYYSIPYEMYQKGSCELENEAVCGYSFIDMEPSKIMNDIEEAAEFL